jgi:hypothetical protein
LIVPWKALAIACSLSIDDGRGCRGLYRAAARAPCPEPVVYQTCMRVACARAPDRNNSAGLHRALSTDRECRAERGRPDDDRRAEADPEEDRHHDAEAAVVACVEVESVLEHEARDDHQQDEPESRQDGAGKQLAPPQLPVGEDPGSPREIEDEQADPPW